MTLSPGNKKLISKIVMEPEEYAGQMYPLNLYTKWNRNNYGPIWIPAKGATITLTEDNLPIYERLHRSLRRQQAGSETGRYLHQR